MRTVSLAVQRFRTFCQKHDRCILKRRTDYGGHGAELADLSADTADALYDRMVAEDLIAEELERMLFQAMKDELNRTGRLANYKGKRDYRVMRKMTDEREYDPETSTLTIWVGKLIDGDFTLTHKESHTI